MKLFVYNNRENCSSRDDKVSQYKQLLLNFKIFNDI